MHTQLVGLIKYSFPAGLIAFLAVTLQVKSSIDGEYILSYGFPLSWYSPSNSLSMAYTIAVWPLVLDLLLYLVASQILLTGTPIKRIHTTNHGYIVSFLLWVCALALVLFTSLVIFSDPQFVAWSLDDYFNSAAISDYNIQIGPGLAK
jgi:hypothetical protein